MSKLSICVPKVGSPVSDVKGTWLLMGAAMRVTIKRILEAVTLYCCWPLQPVECEITGLGPSNVKSRQESPVLSVHHCSSKKVKYILHIALVSYS